ncbi:hypothetical protein AcW1_002276 [Taiwanofungus camphoratus]|nr:hypothetical protein AcW1_002276 [Antrodia cinnamomea]
MRISAGEVVMGAETGSGIGRREGAVGEMLRRVPTGILTNREWVALARTCIRAKDGRAAESVLDLMKRSGTFELEESVDEVLAHYATAGDVPSIERVLHAFAPSVPSERQRDLHVKAHIKATPRSAQPTAAMSLLHAYEARGLPAPQKSYTRTIAAFLAARTRPAHANALAWDLFAHMRYAAHPTPDASTYALMLRACAPPHRPADPARALDLLAEMTGDAGLAPTPAAYGAAALACARSGEKHHVHEAFRLAKEMLDAHRDARGRAQFRPDQRLFRALLEGAKRVGDLGRVRWILAEMVRESEGRGEAGGPGDVCVNEEVMVHVFNAYAAYRPTFRRGLTVLVDKQGGSAPPTEQTQETPVSAVGENVVQPHSNTSEPSQETPRIVADPDVQEDFEQAGLSAEAMGPQFSHIPPQSRSEAVAEAKILFNRIMTEHVHSQDADHSSPDQEQDAQLTSPRLFHHVRLTPRLLNAYLSVHYAHSPFDVWSDLHRTLFDEAGVSKNARSYVEVLERCTLCRRGQERRMALRLAEESWSEWQGIEEAWRAGSAGEGDVAKTVDARLVERANAAMIRMLSLTENSRRALEHVRAFTERYPPERVRVTPPKPSLLSTRTVLVGARPLVRLTSTVDIPDDCVPPLLTFSELEVLHIRLVALEDRAGIRYLKWVCKAYEGSLRRRRNASMRAVPEGSEPDQTQVHNQNSS